MLEKEPFKYFLALICLAVSSIIAYNSTEISSFALSCIGFAIGDVLLNNIYKNK